MQPYLDTILAITKEAEKIPRKYFRKGLAVDHKPDASPVTLADQSTEQYIRTEIARHFPDHSIFGEEFGQTTGNSRFQWIIDPIDGTRSFISGMPLYGMLIALLEDGAPVLGVVRMPELAEVFTGSAAGTFLNGDKALHVSITQTLDEAFIYINEADKILANAPDTFHKLNITGRDRRFGYDCYPHALVAAGHIDACIDYDLKPYDYLPLVAVVEGAGGMISDWRGFPLTMESDGSVVSAATPELHQEILKILN
ncbi:MAG: inositol monophosphatase family protein [Paracoccaceae bacterium]